MQPHTPSHLLNNSVTASEPLAVITGLEELWKELAEAKEINGFLELPKSISKIFPKASSGKLLVRDAYKILLRVFERRSGVNLVQPEYYASIASQSEGSSSPPAKKQKTGKLSLPKYLDSLLFALRELSHSHSISDQLHWTSHLPSTLLLLLLILLMISCMQGQL